MVSLSKILQTYKKIHCCNNAELAKKLNLELDDYGYIVVNRKQETNVKGIYAAGDITGGILQTCIAVGEGATAAVHAYLYIQGGWYSEK